MIEVHAKASDCDFAFRIKGGIIETTVIEIQKYDGESCLLLCDFRLVGNQNEIGIHTIEPIVQVRSLPFPKAVVRFDDGGSREGYAIHTSAYFVINDHFGIRLHTGFDVKRTANGRIMRDSAPFDRQFMSVGSTEYIRFRKEDVPMMIGFSAVHSGQK